ncbi:MAG: BREX-2 system adenine-specific DNA-methyltransferase PglX [Chromatiales bacterium]|nr:BREX-2 system adenine-specific DNA-methyltransferase PglX [Chromatiales bacterium]
MIDRKALLADLRRQSKRLEVDLAERAGSVSEMAATLEAEYRAAQDAERTGDTFTIWRTGALNQAAVAWLLGCIFVRFAEDNGLVDAPLIAGPGERNARAADRQTLYFHARPTDSDRDYLLDVFAEAARLPGIGPLYHRAHNPIWRHGISGDAARDLLAFWRAVDPDTGALRHDFTDAEWDTRFLGDLYQDLSEEAKKRFALLQTPEFVEEFILDRTLTPAVDEFGLPDLRLIDPACGSGHFLLGAFARLLRAWFTREPGTPERVLVQRALDGVHGVDLNPFAVAIARFRLLVAALRASRIERLRDAPDFRIAVAAGDSLLHGRRFDELDLGSGADQLGGRDAFGHAFQAEDLGALNRILGQRYHVVVGNPPYVTVKDKAVNRLYRERYGTCHRQYSLAVPFTERFFRLALPGTGATASRVHGAGYVGLITANSFMKREFGKKLIQSFFPTIDLTHVIDTSGAYIPGHGTPTVILLGRHRAPVGDVVRTVMGIRGEPATPSDPSKGLVWSAIVEQVDITRSESDWVSSEDVARTMLSSHPWSIGGGGERQLYDSLVNASVETLGDVSTEIGRTTHTGEDDVFYLCGVGVAHETFEPYCVSLVLGEDIRDWSLAPRCLSIFPYENTQAKTWLTIPTSLEPHFWRFRTRLRARRDFGQYIEQRGLKWFEHSMFFKHRYRSLFSIAIAFVATHNHFGLDRGGKVFKQSAPVIKLPADATEADHLALLGVLNSSVACFWMKQVFHNKGSTVDAHGARQTTDAFENFYEYTATGLKQFPLPANRPTALARTLDRLAAERQAHLPAQLADRFPMAPAELNAHRDAATTLLARMIALQEELDWECYLLYGLVAEDCRYAGVESPTSERPSDSQPVHTDQSSDNGVPESAGILPASTIADLPGGIHRGPSARAGRMLALPGAATPNPVSRQASGVTLCDANEANHHGERSSHPESAASDDHRNPNDAGTHREPPPLSLAERAFEIVMARRMAAGELETTWFARHGATPITELPAHWPHDYRALVERRIALVESDRFIGLVERPEYKRRWNVESWHDQEQRALRRWLLDRLESPAYRPETRLTTVRTLAQRAATDADFQQVATRYAGHVGADLDSLVETLVESESVPALPILRYKPSGLAKRADWERTWTRQRHEDRIDAEVEASTPRRGDETGEQHTARLEATQRRRKREEVGEHPPPPKYRSADFLKPVYWRLRGALDVPKERFVSFPTMSRDGDPTPLVGWAGWNPLDLCQAVATYCTEVIEQDGWPPERATPLLAVVQENLPWLKQWHNEIDPEYNQRLGDFFETWLHSQLSILGLTEEDLRAWVPPEIKPGPRTKRRTAGARGAAVPGPSLPPTG